MTAMEHTGSDCLDASRQNDLDHIGLFTPDSDDCFLLDPQHRANTFGKSLHHATGKRNLLLSIDVMLCLFFDLLYECSNTRVWLMRACRVLVCTFAMLLECADKTSHVLATKTITDARFPPQNY